MQHDSPNQNADRKSDGKGTQGKKKQVPRRPNPRIIRVHLFGWVFAVSIGVAGYLISFSHKFSLASILLVVVGVVFAGLAIRLLLINHQWRHRTSNLIGMLVIASGIVFGLVMIWWEYKQPPTVAEAPRKERLAAESEDRYSGELIPANDPDPSGVTLNTNFVTLFLGNSTSTAVWFPHTVIQRKGKPLLTINKSHTGASISAEFFGENGNVVCVLESNKFIINPSNYLMRDRPDTSTLIVRDQKNKEVLNVRFLNPHAIRLSARFRFPDRPDFVISKDEGVFKQTIQVGATMVDFVIP